MADKVRIGVIGVGQIGKHHLDNYRKIDQAQIVAESEIRTWKLPRVELEAVAKTLRELSSAGHLGATDSGAAVAVTVDAASDTLIVSGPSAIFERVAKVIDSLESGPITPSTSLRTFRLLQARAIDFDVPAALGSLNFVHKYLAGSVVFLA